MSLTEVRTGSSVALMLERRLIFLVVANVGLTVYRIRSAIGRDCGSVAVSAEPELIDRAVHNVESELEMLVEQYRVGLPPQQLAEVFGRFFALECLRGYGVQAFQCASAGFVAILEAVREMSRNQPQ